MELLRVVGAPRQADLGLNPDPECGRGVLRGLTEVIIHGRIYIYSRCPRTHFSWSVSCVILKYAAVVSLSFLIYFDHFAVVLKLE